MFLVELIASSFFYLISKQARAVCRFKRVLVFFVLIGQNLTGEFMAKIYAASGNLLTDSRVWPKSDFGNFFIFFITCKEGNRF